MKKLFTYRRSILLGLLVMLITLSCQPELELIVKKKNRKSEKKRFEYEDPEGTREPDTPLAPTR